MFEVTGKILYRYTQMSSYLGIIHHTDEVITTPDPTLHEFFDFMHIKHTLADITVNQTDTVDYDIQFMALLTLS